MSSGPLRLAASNPDGGADPPVGLPPHPPILIGGGGRRLLTLAAREAEIVGLAPRVGEDGRADVASLLAPATAEKIEWVREAAGERFERLELNVYPSVSRIIVTDHPRREVAELAASPGPEADPPGEDQPRRSSPPSMPRRSSTWGSGAPVGSPENTRSARRMNASAGADRGAPTTIGMPSLTALT